MQKSETIRLLFFAGSARADSFNKKLARLACELATQHSVQATFIDLQDYNIPLYNADAEAQHGLPQAVQQLKELFGSHDGFFVACPEYNGMPPPLLINTLDWLSRRSNEQEQPLAAFVGKTAALAAASPGNLGGLRALPHLRNLLSNLGVTVVPQQLAIGSATSAFDANGHLTNTTHHKQLTALLAAFVALVQAVTNR